MNDGQYTNLRNYLEEIASTSKQVLAEQKRTNELLEQSRSQADSTEIGDTGIHLVPAGTVLKPPIPPEADADGIMPAPASSKPKVAAKKSNPKPNVNWNS